MARDIDTDAVTAAGQPHVPYVWLVDFDFESGHIYLNSSDRDYVYGGHTYVKTYGVCGMSSIKESLNLAAEPVEFTLPGVDPDLIAVTLGEDYHGRDVLAYVAYLNADREIESDPVLAVELQMEKMTVHRGDRSATIKLVCENRLNLWNRASGWLYTNDHQKTIWGSGDNFFGQIAAIIDSIIVWLNKEVGTGYVRNASVSTQRY